ncbi:MAG: anti-sigma factor RsiW [Limisphaerales bacterium]|jgi:anti-sigma factor RsiW
MDGLTKMNETEYQELLEIRHQRELTPAELHRLEQWLAAHQEQSEEWEAEDTLSKLLEQLPDAEASSNFTSQVWQKIELEARASAPQRSALMKFFRGHWLPIPRVAGGIASVVVVVALVLVQQRQAQKTAKLAANLVPVVELAQMPSVDMLRDFEAINSLVDPDLTADVELLSMLGGLR